LEEQHLENFPAARVLSTALALPAVLAMSVVVAGCGSSNGTGDRAGDAATGQAAFGATDDGGSTVDAAPGADGPSPLDTPDATAGSDGATGMAVDSGGRDGSGTSPGDARAADGGFPSGWLYTSGGHIYQSGASTTTPWMGRGVNTDDIFLCGYDNSLWMTNPGQTVQTVLSGLITGWKPNFLRMSLAMDSYGTTVSWLANPSQYKDPMTAVIGAIGTHPGVYVLVTLRSDASMIGHFTGSDPEATGVPSDATTSPDKTKFPTGTDATYIGLVDSFASDGFVLFGLTNEPGGNSQSNATIKAAMSHAVGVIRAEEDRLGVPHHIVSVQGNNWTSDISFYASSPLPYDNVVYEVHGYPPPTASYTYSNIPVILGEYGSLTSSSQAAFYADVEAKQIPNLAWDFDSYSNCSPDLVNVTTSATQLTPTAWGNIVKAYLGSH
jgi:hypothetical protein